MKQEDILKDKLGRDAGFRVPEGYFDAAFARINASLPEQAPVQEEVKPTLWKRVRPYLYMAAMFAGIWCMMKVFHNASTPAEVSLDNPPEAIAAVMAGMDSDSDYIEVGGYDDDYHLEAAIINEYSDFEEFEEDFGYELSDAYEDINISAIVNSGDNKKNNPA